MVWISFDDDEMSVERYVSLMVLASHGMLTFFWQPPTVKMLCRFRNGNKTGIQRHQDGSVPLESWEMTLMTF